MIRPPASASRSASLVRLLVGLTAFLPFETVAKATLVFAAALFVFEPFPLARLYCFVSLLVVLGLTKLRNAYPPPRDDAADKRD